MSNYVFIESRDPFISPDVRFVAETAMALRKRGHSVVFFLIQNGVLVSRQNASDSYLARLSQTGVTLLADDFSLSERGIGSAELRPEVQRSSIETLVDTLVQEHTKAIWH